MGIKSEQQTVSAQEFLNRLSRMTVKPKQEKSTAKKPDVYAILAALGVPVGTDGAS